MTREAGGRSLEANKLPKVKKYFISYIQLYSDQEIIILVFPLQYL